LLKLGVWPAAANLPSGVTVTSAKALLRNALPISNKPIRAIQKQLEAIDEYVRIPGNTGFSNVVKAANNSLRVAKDRSDQILADVAPSKKVESLKIGVLETNNFFGDRKKLPRSYRS